ncbi:hypothetical protein SESBI_50142 [Sesbania bispinosa]|nr:hypothetical protein SESBI_50142 [Sesbania bispinosa]
MSQKNDNNSIKLVSTVHDVASQLCTMNISIVRISDNDDTERHCKDKKAEIDSF